MEEVNFNMLRSFYNEVRLREIIKQFIEGYSILMLSKKFKVGKSTIKRIESSIESMGLSYLSLKEKTPNILLILKCML